MTKAPAPPLKFHVILWSLHALAALIVGLSFFPMVAFLRWIWIALGGYAAWIKILAFSLSLGFGYFLFGTTLILLCVLAKNVLRLEIKPGLHAFYTDASYSWMAYNSLILIANAAFLDVLRISPFQTLFYRLMDAKVGDGCQINTAGLADLAMLDIGDNVIIGGGTALICHAAERGLLRLAPTKIGARASIGLNSVIMPDVEIGEGASIAPCSYVPKGSRIPARGSWGGNPVKDLRAERRAMASAEPSESAADPQ